MKTELFLLFSIPCFLFAFQATFGQSAEENLNYRLKQNMDDLHAIKGKIDRYVSDGRIWLADELDEKWLIRAVSLKARSKWAEQEMLNPAEKKLFDQPYQSLAASIVKKIAIHKPSLTYFTKPVSSAEEEAIRSALDNPTTLVIHKTGIVEEKGQQSAISPPRKTAFVWASNRADDYSYCHLYKLTITRNYSGGGRYDGDLSVVVNDDVLVGCP